MIISTLDELRLHLPANAIDNIDSLTGFIETSEYDTLRDKLGKSLFSKLISFYTDLGSTGISELINDLQVNNTLAPYERLLFISQRIVAFDAIANAVGAHAVSINGAGINTMTADDYPQADKEKIATFQTTCRTECHKSINLLLETLEDWVKDLANDDVVSSMSADITEITTAWQSSRYYFLSEGMILPTAQVLNDYLNIYDNREKFILMLPDIRYIHEEVLAQSIGDDFLAYLADLAIKGVNTTTVPDVSTSGISILSRIITRLRKAAAAHLESRTNVLKTDKDRRVRAHDEAISLTDQVCEYIHNNQSTLEDILPEDALTAFQSSPLYIATVTDDSAIGPKFQNNRSGNAFFATPGLR